MQQSVSLNPGYYVLNGDCKARTVSGSTMYERICMQYQSNGMSTWWHAWFNDASCTSIRNAYAMNATLINAGVNQFLQRNNKNLDMFVVYPWTVKFETTLVRRTDPSARAHAASVHAR